MLTPDKIYPSPAFLAALDTPASPPAASIPLPNQAVEENAVEPAVNGSACAATEETPERADESKPGVKGMLAMTPLGTCQLLKQIPQEPATRGVWRRVAVLWF